MGFSENCSEEFLKRDNKVCAATVRTNMVTGGMFLREGKPLFHYISDWRSLIGDQGTQYKEDPQLLAWDIACNLAAEKCKKNYQELSKDSYLNPEKDLQNVKLWLNQLPKDGD